jgi:hypothetical protein
VRVWARDSDRCGYRVIVNQFNNSAYPIFLCAIFTVSHVRWVPCHHGMARPQISGGGNALQLWTIAANILNKQSQTADKGLSSSLGVGSGATNSSP